MLGAEEAPTSNRGLAERGWRPCRPFPSDGAGTKDASHSLLKHPPGGPHPGEALGDGTAPTLEVLTVAGGCAVSRPVLLTLDKVLNPSDTCFSHL